MSSVMETGMDGACGDVQRTERGAGGEREVRGSARRKEGVVMRLMRLLRGESLDLLARETGQPARRIASWREEFLAAGREGFEGPPGGDRGLRAARGPAQGRRALDGGRHPHGSAGCQWPSVSPHWRPRISPLVAIFSPRWWPRISPPTEMLFFGV